MILNDCEACCEEKNFASIMTVKTLRFVTLENWCAAASAFEHACLSCACFILGVGMHWAVYGRDVHWRSLFWTTTGPCEPLYHFRYRCALYPKRSLVVRKHDEPTPSRSNWSLTSFTLPTRTNKGVHVSTAKWRKKLVRVNIVWLIQVLAGIDWRRFRCLGQSIKHLFL